MQACARVETDLQLLLRGGQANVFLQVAEQGGQIDGLCGARIRVQTGQGENFADQRFQSITLLTQTGPEPFSLRGIGGNGEPIRGGIDIRVGDTVVIQRAGDAAVAALALRLASPAVVVPATDGEAVADDVVEAVVASRSVE